MKRWEVVAKLSRAIRCLRGRKRTNGKWFRAPDIAAQARVDRWAFRARRLGIISEETESKLKSG